MKLREKVRLVLRAIPRTRGPEVVGLVMGVVMLVAAPFFAGILVVSVLAGHWSYAFAAAANLPILLTQWGHAWRLAVDVPMGDAWYDLPLTRRVLCGASLTVAVTFAVDGEWTWAFVMVLCALTALVTWPDPGHGGGGWDDPIDAPRPDPSTAA